MVEMRAVQHMPPLPALCKALSRFGSHVTDCSYRSAKPCRIYLIFTYRGAQVRQKKKKTKKVPGLTLQIFPKGCIQALGIHPPHAYEAARAFLSVFIEGGVTAPIVKSCTILCYWNNDNVNLRIIPSNKHICNEREIFPSTQVNHSSSERIYHCSLFQNGKAIITGVRSISEAQRVLTHCIMTHIQPQLPCMKERSCCA